MSIFTLAFLIVFGIVMLVTLGLILVLGSGRPPIHRPARRASDGGSYGVHSSFDSGGSTDGGGGDCGGFDGGGGDCGGGDGGGGGGGD